ncbi:MAG: signal peptidase I [Edaphobacter sp.]
MIPPVLNSQQPQAQEPPLSLPEKRPDAPVVRPYPVAPRRVEAAKTGVLHSLQSLIYIIVSAIFIITFCVQPFRIPSGSMEPTLLVGDFLLVVKQSPLPDAYGSPLPSGDVHRGDIIVFHYPVDPDMHLIKRVVGIPGDHLKLRAGLVYINGVPLHESYAVYRPGAPDSFRDNFPRLQSADPDINSRWWIRMRTLIDNGELIIPAGNYFVLGDNRNDSEDSRYWGFVPRADIVGKPLLIYFSLRQGSGDSGLLAGTAAAATPAPKHPGPLDVLTGFARWSRSFQIVR